VPVTGANEETMQLFSTKITGNGKPQDLYLVFRNTNAPDDLLQLDWVYFDNGQQPVPKE